MGFPARALAALSLGVLTAGPASAAEEPVTREALPNGARIVMQPRPGSGTFALELIAIGGSLEDPDDAPGLTAVLARLLLRGAGERSAARQALDVERGGAEMTPAHGPLGFGLRAWGPTASFQTALDVALEALLSPHLTPEALESEAALERQELAAGFDNPSSAMERAILPLVFGGHPLGRASSPKTWAHALDVEDVRRAHAARIAGSRLLLVMAGDLPPVSAIESGRRALATLPRGAPPAPLPPLVPLAGEARDEVNVRTTQPMLFVGAPTAGLPPDQWATMDLLAHILTGFQERISVELREKRGWAYWVDAIDRRYPAAGLFGVLTAVPKRRLGESEAIVRGELERLASEPPAGQELERARRILLTERARAWQRSAERARTFAFHELRGAPAPSLADQEAALRAITAVDVTALAKRLLGDSRLAVVTLK